MSDEAECENGENTFKTPFLPPPEVPKISEDRTFKKPETGTIVEEVSEGAAFRKQEPPGEPEASLENTPRNSIPKLFPAQKCPYEEPSWGGTPETVYKVVVLRSGVIVSEKKLNKSYVVVGRHQDCDIILEHPSISRFHAVLQYRRPSLEAPEAAQKLKGRFPHESRDLKVPCRNSNLFSLQGSTYTIWGPLTERS